ncbi:phage tail protein [Thiotrichales bacterium 19S3-7]|nr:phage tail protein [Thiotrichales bacterium 19S3-7]MCF6802555.1 phage tail protein [Thiotrichales bacterium 19S3-11]
MNISISTFEINAFSSQMKGYDGKHIEKYTATAVNRAAKSVRGRLAKDIAAELGIKQKLVRQRLGFYRKGKYDVKLWFGLNPIELDRLGKPKAQKSDVMVKGIRIENAFVSPSGKIKKRTDMSRPAIEINKKAQAIIENRLPYYFRETFFKKLEEVLKWKLKTQGR